MCPRFVLHLLFFVPFIVCDSHHDTLLFDRALTTVGPSLPPSGRNEIECQSPDDVPLAISHPIETDCWTALLNMRRDRDFLHQRTYAYRLKPRGLPAGTEIDRELPVIWESGTCVVQIDLFNNNAFETLVIKDAYMMALRVLDECVRKPTSKYRMGGFRDFHNHRAVVSVHGSLGNKYI